MNELDESTCWYSSECIKEMNGFYDAHCKNQEVLKHLIVFRQLLDITDETGEEILDLGTGTAMLSEFCSGFKFTGSDLPHILSGCAMRNYPQYMYRACDIVKDELNWIDKYKVVIANGVIDIMQYPIDMLKKCLLSSSKYFILHRQEITESGKTRVIKNSSYNSVTYHSIINRKDFMDAIEECGFSIIKELPLPFGNWENGGSSFLLRKKKSWSLNNIDLKLDKYFGRKENGFFIEAGANDGLSQSNTMFLEFYRDWKGILVEPIEEIFIKCKENRSASAIFVNSAIGDKESTAKIAWSKDSNGLLGVMNEGDISSRLKKMLNVNQDIITSSVKVTTLNSILTKFEDRIPNKIDLLVIDVEGYEMEALRGLDIAKWDIEYILVEELEKNPEVNDYLKSHYTMIDKLSHHDYLYRRLQN